MMSLAITERHGVVCFTLRQGRVYAAARACGADLRNIVRLGLRNALGVREEARVVARVLHTISVAPHVGLAAVGLERAYHDCSEIHVDLVEGRVREVDVFVEALGEYREVVLCEWTLRDFVEGINPVSLGEAGPGVPR